MEDETLFSIDYSDSPLNSNPSDQNIVDTNLQKSI